MPNLESGELSAGRLRIHPFVTNVPDHAFADVIEEGDQFVLFSFGDQLDLAVGQIADETEHIVSFGDCLRRVAETDSLHVAAIVDCPALMTDRRAHASGVLPLCQFRPVYRDPAGTANLDRRRRFF